MKKRYGQIIMMVSRESVSKLKLFGLKWQERKLGYFSRQKWKERKLGWFSGQKWQERKLGWFSAKKWQERELVCFWGGKRTGA